MQKNVRAIAAAAAALAAAVAVAVAVAANRAGRATRVLEQFQADAAAAAAAARRPPANAVLAPAT